MAEQAVHDEHSEIKKRAIRRLIVAGLLVVAAIVTLTVLSHKPEEQAVPATTSAAPATVKPEPAAPAALPEKPTEEAPVEVPAPETPTVPDSEAAPAVPPPPPPQVVNKTSQAMPAAAPKMAGTELAAPAKSSTPQSVTISPSPLSKKPAEPVTAESRPAAAPAVPAVKTTEAAPSKGHVVQLGLFSNHENAVQLQKRLAEHGIQSHTETRLYVGPFQNKAEADQALSKIRGMGINAVLAPAR